MSQNALNWRNTGADMRTAPRQPIIEPCFIVTYGKKDGVQCTLRDYSDNGARLSVENGYALPLHFRLNTAADRDGFRCEVVWRKPKEVGVRFIDG